MVLCEQFLAKLMIPGYMFSHHHHFLPLPQTRLSKTSRKFSIRRLVEVSNTFSKLVTVLTWKYEQKNKFVFLAKHNKAYGDYLADNHDDWLKISCVPPQDNSFKNNLTYRMADTDNKAFKNFITHSRYCVVNANSK